LKIKLDENLPRELGPLLRGMGHDADSVHDEGLDSRPDPDIWAAAQTEGRFFVTQDMDFSDARFFEPGTHAGLLLVRLKNPSRSALTRVVHGFFLRDAHGCPPSAFIVLSERGPRLYRPE
jgi:predicted nuclease of predicted toxin-antitoxin system